MWVLDARGLPQAVEGEVVGFVVAVGEVMPVEVDGEVFDAIAEGDAVAAGHLAIAEESVGQVLGAGPVVAVAAVDDVEAFFLVVGQELLDVGAEAGEVAGDGGDA